MLYCLIILDPLLAAPEEFCASSRRGWMVGRLRFGKNTNNMKQTITTTLADTLKTLPRGILGKLGHLSHVELEMYISFRLCTRNDDDNKKQNKNDKRNNLQNNPSSWILILLVRARFALVHKIKIYTNPCKLYNCIDDTATLLSSYCHTKFCCHLGLVV